MTNSKFRIVRRYVARGGDDYVIAPSGDMTEPYCPSNGHIAAMGSPQQRPLEVDMTACRTSWRGALYMIVLEALACSDE
jgi:hypothetical protein